MFAVDKAIELGGWISRPLEDRRPLWGRGPVLLCYVVRGLFCSVRASAQFRTTPAASYGRPHSVETVVVSTRNARLLMEDGALANMVEMLA
jgi:hypothetical protein